MLHRQPAFKCHCSTDYDQAILRPFIQRIAAAHNSKLNHKNYHTKPILETPAFSICNHCKHQTTTHPLLCHAGATSSKNVVQTIRGRRCQLLSATAPPCPPREPYECLRTEGLLDLAHNIVRGAETPAQDLYRINGREKSAGELHTRVL